MVIFIELLAFAMLSVGLSSSTSWLRHCAIFSALRTPSPTVAGLGWHTASLFPTLPERLSRALLDVPPRRYAEGAPSVAASRELLGVI
jgi:hypothetical protein